MGVGQVIEGLHGCVLLLLVVANNQFDWLSQNATSGIGQFNSQLRTIAAFYGQIGDPTRQAAQKAHLDRLLALAGTQAGQCRGQSQ
jgi:hypothetical protein